MSELARIANQIRRLDSLISRSNRALQEDPAHAGLAVNIPGMEALRFQLERRFSSMASKIWMDVCTYRFRAAGHDFLPVRQMVQTLGGFQQTVGLTMDAQIAGRPKERAYLSKEASADSTLRLGYCFGGETYGDVGIAMVAENRRDLLDSMNQAVETVLSIAQSTDTDQVHAYSQTLGAAPIRAFAEWCHHHVRADMDAEVSWLRDSEVRRVVRKSPEQWRELKETIDLVSDSLSDEIEMDGILIAANSKTRAFVIDSGGDLVHGRFREGLLSRSKVAEIPKDYHFVLTRTIRHNLATDRITTDYVLVELTPLRRPRRSDPPAP